ncbi:CoA pyrophosphatase [Rhizobium sp. SSA_523]|uniref:CoA pyrophosphatase n=1 Tax=Rhizobium sp. SSA_523 TaxID=2952477 RepID=UPI00209122DD|nr:CoA pyrophosphatase [Rhizobium sp. SSA_523]MCO5730435.1 CoA pyrophosphatase [Rhizobium sp. SSA_523]WKC25478.1 CoA pyrophosphatase [Rhizobium sp. SSA_523]
MTEALLDPNRFSAEEFRRRAQNQSGAPLAQAIHDHGDHLLNPDIVAQVEGLALKDAAVLVPVVDDRDGGKVILTQRATKLRKHSGQIAFPGGAIDLGDTGAEGAALREAQEEIGLSPHFVEPVGRLPDYYAASGFRITPVLAVVRRGFTLKLNPDEVDKAFEVPLSFLMDPHNHAQGSREWQGAIRRFYRMPYGEWNIWGITAGIIRTLYERLYR